MCDYAELAKALRICGNRDSDCEGCPLRGKYYFNDCAFAVDVNAADAIEELVELVPKRGTWIGSADGYADGELVYDMWECSVCGFDADGADERPGWSYCPHCGAKMEVSEDARD